MCFFKHEIKYIFFSKNNHSTMNIFQQIKNSIIEHDSKNKYSTNNNNLKITYSNIKKYKNGRFQQIKNQKCRLSIWMQTSGPPSPAWRWRFQLRRQGPGPRPFRRNYVHPIEFAKMNQKVWEGARAAMIPIGSPYLTFWGYK